MPQPAAVTAAYSAVAAPIWLRTRALGERGHDFLHLWVVHPAPVGRGCRDDFRPDSARGSTALGRSGDEAGVCGEARLTTASSPVPRKVSENDPATIGTMPTSTNAGSRHSPSGSDALTSIVRARASIARPADAARSSPAEPDSASATDAPVSADRTRVRPSGPS